MPDRLLLIGAGSFIARHVAQAARQEGLVVTDIRHGDDPAPALAQADIAINCAIAPAFFTEPWRPEIDQDLRAARAAAAAGVPFVMLSTRRVYPLERRWNAVEQPQPEGDETIYGRNKAASEQAVLAAGNGAALILRLSNVFGFEYSPDGGRRNFFASMLGALRHTGTIQFDMSPATRRDFIPVEACARAILAAATGRLTGTFNLGSGFATPCGELADWVMEGYGGGALAVSRDEVRDEFFLNMAGWRGKLPLPIDRDTLKDAAIAVGRKLRHA